MPPSKLKRRRGNKSKGAGAGKMIRVLLCGGILIVIGVICTLFGGLQEALNRQAAARAFRRPFAHGEMDQDHALTRPSDGGGGGLRKDTDPRHNVQNENLEQHQLSLLQQAENAKQRLEGRKGLLDGIKLAAGAAAENALINRGGGFPHPPRVDKIEHLDIPNVKIDESKLGGPYPYPLEPPPAGYDIHASYEPLGGFRFAEYTKGDTPYLITDEIRQKSDEVARARRKFIKEMLQFAWKGYVEHAFGQDEIKPNSATGDNGWGGFGVTLVDTLDTLWLTGMKEEFWQARDWVRDHLNNDKARSVSVFETTIRSLGGLLSAYDWSGDQAFLDKAMDLARRLIKSFDGSSTGLPSGQINMASGRPSNIQWARGNVILSEFGTVQMEYRFLDECLKTSETAEMRRKAEHVFEVLHQPDVWPKNGLFPYYYSNQEPDGIPKPRNDHLTFGAMADSFYEYMLKVWVQGGKVEPMYREMYDRAIQGMHDELLQTSTPSGLVYIADKIGSNRIDHKMDHLVCFMGGLLALGAYTDPLGLESERAQRDVRTGKALTYTCYQMYARMNTGISAEFVQFVGGEDFRIGQGAPHYLLRPETVESFFILSQLTGDPVYREWGWEVFQSIEKYCRTGVGYGTLSTVQRKDQKPRDKMETFFLAETVKYMYLLQDPDTEVDVLNKHVFNTEAHPLRNFPTFRAAKQ